MKANLRQFKHLFTTLILVLVFAQLPAQTKQGALVPLEHTASRSRLKQFKKLAAQAGVKFTFPRGFREVKAPDNEDFSFDYGMALPGQDFEIWLLVLSEREDWASYERTLDKKGQQLENPDSVYIDLGKATATAFTGDQNYFVKNIPPDVLARYNADAGKSYLLTLLDMRATKHYKYALLITLQKNHTGTILAVCFTNDKGPEFYKNMYAASHSLVFK